MMAFLDGEAAEADPEELIQEIESGLDSIAFEPGQRVPLVNFLRKIIVDGDPDETVRLVEVPREGVAQTLGSSDVIRRETVREQIRDEQKDNADCAFWRDPASRLHVGEWLEISATADESRIAIIAWPTMMSPVSSW